MDRRSWLWRRKSSEKSPGETESVGSVSSHSERFSDDQAYATHSTQSPEVTSKALSNNEDAHENVKTLTDKLSAALLDISSKEDLVKQHAKVAEEAVSGWEKAEKEVLVLRKKLETTSLKNSALEDRLGHLDGALKECVRQLRQAREDQEQKIREVVAKKTREWDSLKSDLESQLVNLQAQLQSVKTEAVALIDSDVQAKLDAAEKENWSLKLELLSRAKELEIGILERDLSIKAAETASKQHLESIKKVAKLEAECRRLRAIARKASQNYDQKSLSASSVYVESFMDSQSDCGERLLTNESGVLKMNSLEPNEHEPCQSGSSASAIVTDLQFRNEKEIESKLMTPSTEINLMDDFLEMERLAALPVIGGENSSLEPGPISDQSRGGESRFKADLEAMIERTANLEEKIEKMETEKVELEMALSVCEKQLETSQSRLLEAEMELKELKKELLLANESKRAVDEEVKATQTKRELVESQLRGVENEANTLLFKVASLEEEVHKERAVSADNLVRCQKLEDELLSMKSEAENQREAELQRFERTNVDLKIKQEKELALAAEKFAECQKTIASLGQQLKSLASLEDFLMDSEKPLELSGYDTQSYRNGIGQNLQSSDFRLPKSEMGFSEKENDCLYPLKNRTERMSLFSLDPAMDSQKN